MNRDFNNELNTDLKNAFGHIHAENALKERTKDYLSQKIYNHTPRWKTGFSLHLFRKTTVFRRAAALAACLIALLFIGGSWVFMTPTAFISIDINPSLELGINRFNRIVSIRGYNEDGEELAGSLDIRFMDYDAALVSLLDSQELESYLSPDALITFTVAGDSEAQYNEIFECVESCADGRSDIQCHSGDMSEMQNAHEAGLSFGKYRAYLILKEFDSSVTPDDIRDLTMRELYDLIDSYSDSSESENISSADSCSGSTDQENRSQEDRSQEDRSRGSRSQGSRHHGNTGQESGRHSHE